MKGYANLGKEQGNMNAHVEDYQRPLDNYSQTQFGTTTEYMPRQNKQQARAASDVKKQAYQGRYS